MPNLLPRGKKQFSGQIRSNKYISLIEYYLPFVRPKQYSPIIVMRQLERLVIGDSFP
jgi:hypothetical protein